MFLLGLGDSLDMVFLASAGIGGFLFVIRMSMMLFGIDGDVGDGAGLDHADSGFGIVSMHSLTAFFLIFGLLGLALHRGSGVSDVWSIIGASIGGAGMMALLGWITYSMRGMVSSGNLDYKQAIGQIGTVYLTIPEGGAGQIEVRIQNRLRVADAIADDRQPIKTGERVEVLDWNAGSFTVKRV